MPKPSALYSDKWRDAVRPGVQSSAAALVPLLVEQFRPARVVDVGCGEGWFVKELEAAGVEAVGVDGSWVDGAQHVDLTAPPYPALGRFDLALCLEVAEHVHERHAAALVGWLCSLAPVVVFSAAIPGQGGTGHVNEQWPGYWRDLFEASGHDAGSGALRWRIWDDDRIEPWYRQNLLAFATERILLFADWCDGCPSVVHPGIWSVYRHG